MASGIPAKLPQQVDALVVGAGFAGLVAALKLVEAKKSVVVLEARERLGGRAFTHTYSKETHGSSARTVSGKKGGDEGVTSVDFGCSWIHGYREGNPVKQYCERFGIPVTVPKAAPAVVIGSKGSLGKDLSDKLAANLNEATSAARAKAAEASTSSTDPLASALTSNNSPLFSGLSSQEEKDVALAYSRMLQVPHGTVASKVALKWLGFEQNFGGTDGAPQGGFTRIIDALADEIKSKGGHIVLNSPVESFEVSDSAKQVTVKSKQQNIKASLALCTVPLATLQQHGSSLFNPALNSKKLEVVKRTNVGNLNKVLLVYERPWWDTSFGTFIILPTVGKGDQDISSASSPLDIFKAVTLMVGAEADRLLVMVGAEAGAAIEKFERLKVVEALHEYLSQRLEAQTTPSSPVHNFMSRWSGHAYTGGATTTPVVVGEHNSPLDFVELSRPEFGGLLGFAGEHTEMNHHGSVAGAVVSGEREAARMIAALDKSEVLRQEHL